MRIVALFAVTELEVVPAPTVITGTGAFAVADTAIGGSTMPRVSSRSTVGAFAVTGADTAPEATPRPARGLFAVTGAEAVPALGLTATVAAFAVAVTEACPASALVPPAPAGRRVMRMRRQSLFWELVAFQVCEPSAVTILYCCTAQTFEVLLLPEVPQMRAVDQEPLVVSESPVKLPVRAPSTPSMPRTRSPFSGAVCVAEGESLLLRRPLAT
ncbi:hypothetical protein ACFY7C_19590 [Streptomyces sp. NPDC012769]|uniref:hypothetical protein n=1 Tax=Streptomyces sp. NPDC012769 TaxID=3364848 RepID=UPI0036C1469D